MNPSKVMESGRYEVPSSLLTYIDRDVVQLPIKFDIERLRTVTTGVVKDFATYERSGGEYLGIPLQICEGMPEGESIYPLTPARRNAGLSNASYVDFNNAGERYDFVWRKFAELGVVVLRARIFTVVPGHSHEFHFDNDYRIHIPIWTNAECAAVFEQGNYHMAADGSAYLHNGYRRHTFRNLGQEPRTHIIFVIGGLSFDSHADNGSQLSRFLLHKGPEPFPARMK